MLGFNYQDYLKYEKYERKLILKDECENKKETKLAEENVEYKYLDINAKKKKNKVNHPHDKMYRLILDNKREVVELLNKELRPIRKIEEKDIEKYNSSYINKVFENLESDVVYKRKDKDIFFLIEHQTKIDYSMPLRILEYEVAIMRSAISRNKGISKNQKLPLVIPIVIYTGKKEWNVKEYIEECQERLELLKEVKTGEYCIIDINKYNQDELIKEKSFIYKVFSLERLKTTEEIVKRILEILEEEKDIENIRVLERIVDQIFRDKLGDKITERILREFEEGGDSMIFEVVDREFERRMTEGMEKGMEKGMRKGRKEGREAVALELVKFGVSEDIILKATKLKKQELEKIRNRKTC